MFFAELHGFDNNQTRGRWCLDLKDVTQDTGKVSSARAAKLSTAGPHVRSTEFTGRELGLLHSRKQPVSPMCMVINADTSYS